MDINDTKKLVKTGASYFTQEGLVLREEARVQVNYYAQMVKLNKSVPKAS